VTGTGKLLRRNAGQSHNFEHKSHKKKQDFNKDFPVDKANTKTIKKLLGRA
jgi:large subunit ribosomal protein L35